MAEIGGERFQVGALIDLTQHMAPHLDQRARAIGRQVQAAKQLLPGRFHHTLQMEKVIRRRIAAIGIGGTADFVRVGREVAVQNIEKGPAARRVERLIDPEGLGRQMGPGNTSPFRQQGVTKRD